MSVSDTDVSEFVRLLMLASADGGPDHDDVELAMRAGDWLLQHGWRRTTPHSYVNDDKSLLFRASPADGIELLVRWGEDWPTTGTVYPTVDFAHALNTLSGLTILPPRYATYGRDALRRAADLLDRTAADLPGAERTDDAARMTLQEAARAVRRLAGQRVPA